MNHLDCPRIGKWIGGCRFEARHDRSAARPLTHPELINLEYPFETTLALKSVAASTYVRDVCRTCGRTIERATDLGRSALAEEGGGR